MKRKFLTLILALVLICSLSAVMLVGCANDKKDDKVDKDNSPNEEVLPPAPSKATSYVALDINPSVELILDENNAVMQVRGLNGDANVLLQGEKDGLIGLDANVAVEKIGKLSAELGYINENNSVINVNVTSALESAQGQKLEADIAANVTKGAEEGSNNTIEVSIKVDGDFSLKREYEAFIAAHPELQDIDIAEYRLMVEAMAADAKLKVEDAAAMTKAELIEFISEAREDAIDDALNLLPEAEKKILEASEDALELLIERIKVNSYLKVAIDENVLDLLYIDDQIDYIVYKNLEITLEDINEAIENAQVEIEEEMNAEEVQEIFDALEAEGIITADEREAAKDENGKYTLDSVEEYLDIKLKNASEEAQKAVEERIDTALDKAEERIEALEEAYENNVPEEVRTRIANIGKEISDKVMAEIDTTLVAGLKEKIANIINNIVVIEIENIDVEALEDIEDAVEEKADTAKEAIESRYGEEYVAKVEAYNDNLENGDEIKAAKAKFEEELNKAVEKATAELEAAKAERQTQNA